MLLTYPKLYMEIDLKETENGCTSLMFAAKEGLYDTCEILLKNRASKTKLDFNGTFTLIIPYTAIFLLVCSISLTR